MIRINLLPQNKRQGPKGFKAIALDTGGNPQLWIFSYVMGGLLWCAALAGIYFIYSNKLKEQQVKNETLVQRIEELKKKSGNLEELKTKLKRSRDLENVVNKLQSARLGPAKVLLEISRILSVNGGPTIDPERLEQLKRDNPLAGFNPNWDVRRVWLTSFKEDNRECKVQGLGKTNEDVAEFLRRLALSDLFGEVTLEKTEAIIDANTKLAMIQFELTCKVKY